ncbi:perlucin-like protein [Mytilus edulis]|uniref:perlucin-like protein n=1 Tax=Mytilus edulis TaxID=6550 RepID=UPI0039EE4CA7
MKMISTLFVIVCCVLVVKSEEKAPRCVPGCRPPCRPGWKEYKDNCYFFSTDQKSWHDAEVECRNMGGNLTQVNDFAENSWIVTMITSKNVTQQNYWMGGNDLKEEGDWRWMNDLSKVNFTSWSLGEPNDYGGGEDCAHFRLTKNYQWNDMPCTNENGYICESP